MCKENLGRDKIRMTKKELISKLDEIAGKIDELAGNLKIMARNAKDIFVLIENLPADADEIDDEEQDK